MTIRLPMPGADVEVHGVLGVFVGADVMSNGEVHFTIRASATNLDLMKVQCQSHGDVLQRISEKLGSVRSTACLWQSSPAGGLYDQDAQTMLGYSDGDIKALEDAQAFQEMLSLRNMAWARSR